MQAVSTDCAWWFESSKGVPASYSNEIFLSPVSPSAGSTAGVINFAWWFDSSNEADAAGSMSMTCWSGIHSCFNRFFVPVSVSGNCWYTAKQYSQTHSNPHSAPPHTDLDDCRTVTPYHPTYPQSSSLHAPTRPSHQKNPPRSIKHSSVDRGGLEYPRLRWSAAQHH